MKKKSTCLTNNILIFRLCFELIAFISLLIISISLYAQKDNSNGKNNDDQKLIDQYVQSKGSRIIVFDSSNIKQFWTSNSVLSQNGLIRIQLYDSFKSIPLSIQLSNVSADLDCSIEVISSNEDLSFSILSSDSKKISSSISESSFIQHHVFSSSFHLADAQKFKFNIVFSSTYSQVLSINKIILSFSQNKNFLSTPGELSILDNISVSGTADVAVTNKSKSSITLKGTIIRALSQNKILTTDNTLKAHATIKNIGIKPSTVYLAYDLYTKSGQRISNQSFPYKNNKKILSIVSSNEDSNVLLVDSLSEWEKNCFIVYNAKEDFSDFPDLSFVNVKIVDVIQKDNGQAEIILDKPLKTAFPQGTKIRIHSPDGATYLYTRVYNLKPNEEITLSSTIKKDDSFFQYSPKALSNGVYYVTPLIQSISDTSDNMIQIKDFSISY